MLFRDLFRDYVPDVRPRLNPHETITVDIDFELNQIKELVSFIAYVLAGIFMRYMDMQPYTRTN